MTVLLFRSFKDFNGLAVVLLTGSILLGIQLNNASAQDTSNVIIFFEKKPAVCLDISKPIIQKLNLEIVIQDFQNIFKQMTGMTIPEAQGNNLSLIPIRVKPLSSPTGWEVFDTQIVQGYEISVTPHEILISSHTRLGIQNAFNSLLDHWGCRWVMIGKLGQQIPKQTQLTLPLGTIKSPKQNYNNSLQAQGGASQDVADWWNRNQGGVEYWMTGQHYWFYAIPPAKYFKDHPEWYSLIGGKRIPKQLCTSNPEVIAKMIEVAKEFLKTRSTCLSFPMDPNDNIDFCQCEKCQAQDPPGVDSWGLPLMTDRVVHFANAVARGIAKEYPDRVVAFYAYLNHAEPPVNVKLEKNVSVGITRSNHCLLHLLPHEECAKSKEYYEMVEKWSKICPRIWTYEYDPVSWTGCLPCPIYMERAASISLLAKKYGVMGGVTDYVPHLNKSYASTYINVYMERRAKADPNLTPDQILSDMCRSFFGPGAEPMEQYYRELAKVTQYKHPDRCVVGFGTYKYHQMFNQKMITTARKFLNKALKDCANQSPYDERVRLVNLSQQYLEAYLEGIWAAQSGNYSKTLAAFDRLGKVIERLDQANAIDLIEADNRIMKTVKLTTLAEYFPDRMRFVRKWRLLGPFNNDQRDADLRTDAFEPIESIDQPVKLPDGSMVQWLDYKSPKGKFEVISAFKGKQIPWRLSYLYAGVNVESQTMQKVQFCMDSFSPFKVYLNGREVYYRPGLDAECPDKRTVVVDLKQGKNVIVFKLFQVVEGEDSGSWGVYFRIKDLKGNPLKYQ